MRHFLGQPQRLLFLGLLCLLFGSSASAQGISVQLDGRNLYFDQPPAMIGGRLLVPLRGIFEALSADVLYDAGTRSIKATKGSTVVQLQLGSRTALIDGRTVYLDVPADTVGGRTMVPLRFVSEALGADVKWEGATKTVVINSNGSATPGGDTTNPETSPPGGPKIDRVVHNGTAPLGPGDALEVVVYGEPGAQATFEILGHTQEIDLPEISAGRYQTRYTIPSGLQVQRGVLLAHLRSGGRESAQEADRQVTIRPNRGNNNNNNNGVGAWQTYPDQNSTVNTTRPQLTVAFPQAVMSGTTRLYVDGIDFSQQARLSGNQLFWQPQYDLTYGQHRAQVRASANSGQTLDYSWSFNIDANAGNTGSFAIQELRPNNGTVTTTRPNIGAIFNQNVSSATLTVDNVNVTNQAGVQRFSNGITWTPSYNLQYGVHRATVTAVDSYNRQASQTWTFTVGNSNGTPSGQGLIVTNIVNGSVVPPVFNVQGSAQPGRQVNVLLEYSPNNILEVITGQTRQISRSVLVGGNGRFDVQLNASSVRSGQNMRITISDGGASPTQVFTVRRQ
jgi:hypothetical protein